MLEALPARNRYRLLSMVTTITTLACSVAQAGQPGSDDVRRTYDRGKVAYDRGDYVTAAREFAAADAASPNSDVLALAIVAAERADDPILGMELVERAETRGLAPVATAGKETFASKVGRLEISCPKSACTATLDGAPLAIGQPVWTRVGVHSLVLEANGATERSSVRIDAQHTTTYQPARVLEIRVATPVPPAPPPRPTEPEQHGIDRTWFFVAAGATVALGAATVASGLDTLSTRDDFHRDRSDAALADSGSNAELRTNILLATTGVFAVGTAVLGAFGVRWSRAQQRLAALEVAHGL